MVVKIVTDSGADLPAELAQELGITVVPLYLRFGEEVFRDRVEINDDEFYQRLLRDPVHPSTTQPTPQDFVNVYQKLSKEADGIVSIHISNKLSGTMNSAMQAKELIEKGCPIEVVDSESVSMGLGLASIAAATAAKAGKDLKKVLAEATQAVPKVHLLGLLDTLKYLLLGGRIGRAKHLVGSILNVKPMLTLQDGEVVAAGQVRTRSKGIDKLVDFASNAANFEDLAIVYNTTPDEAQSLAERVSSVFPRDKIRVARIGPMLGVHFGPSALVVAFREK
ncbi:DegV family protein [Chloroflexota bacterium]